MFKNQVIKVLTMISSLAVAHTWPRGVHAAEVGYDTKERNFSGALPHGEPFQITILAQVGSSATIQYWPYFRSKWKGTVCTDAGSVPAHATTFAARTEIKDGNPKLTFDIPKLYPNQDYCFRLNIKNARPLDDNEKLRLATAIQKALEDLSSGDLDRKQFSSECAAKITDLKPPPPCVVVELFDKHLSLDLKVQRTDDPAAEKRSLTKVLSDALANDSPLKDSLNDYYRRINSHVDFQDAVATLRRHLTELDHLYRPLDLTKAVYTPPPPVPAKKTAKPTAEKPAKQPLPATGAATGDRPEIRDLPEITVPKDTLDRLRKLGVLEPKIDHATVKFEFAMAFKSILDLLPCTEKDASPSDRFKTPKTTDAKMLAAIDGMWSNTCDVVHALDVIHEIKPEYRAQPTVSDITSSEAFMRMTSTLNAVTVAEGSIIQATSAGPREKAFPFYASVDIGMAPIIFSGRTVNLAQYFALNLYFTAVDPDEPLTSKRNPGRSRGANFWRRFSISAGITTTGRQIENARNVTGLIGSQLPLVGLGFRLFRLVRVSGGVALYNLKNVNPVVDKRHLSVAPYVALSLDLALFNWAKNLIQ